MKTTEIEELSALRDELRELVREAHGAVKDLNRAMRDLDNWGSTERDAMVKEIIDSTKTTVNRWVVGYFADLKGKVLDKSIDKYVTAYLDAVIAEGRKNLSEIAAFMRGNFNTVSLPPEVRGWIK